VIEHASGQTHAMHTDSEPLLAAYLWYDELHHSATLVSNP
jgi:hypothetical protein